MAIEMETFAVLVGYGWEAVTKLKTSLQNSRISEIADLVTVDTSVPLMLSDGSGVNDAFEFSGYQLGLEQALTRASGDDIGVVFVNDTALVGHIGSLRHSMLDASATCFTQSTGQAVAFGLVQKCRPPISQVATQGYYFPTFLFGVVAPRHVWAGLQLHNAGWGAASDFDRWYDSLPTQYRDAVSQWLNPTSLLRGWYKASPFNRTRASTFRRKRMSIYLEHSLPDRLARLGIHCIDLREIRPALGWQMKMDRVCSNAQKLAWRTRDWMQQSMKW